MSASRSTDVWHISLPAKWPSEPPWMSFSTLSDLEACPRRWALSMAHYPEIWGQRGYPRVPQPATIEGTIVHLALQTITSALVEGGCTSSSDERAIATLRGLGGYTAIIGRCIERALEPYTGNPRASPTIVGLRSRVTARTPELRLQVQRLLSRLCPVPSIDEAGGPGPRLAGKARRPLGDGSHTEVELRAPRLSWRGVADLLTLSTTRCEIRDFKTGTRKQEHEAQLRVYALLWARDLELNPLRRLASRLVLSYHDGDVDCAAPGETELASLEKELVGRTEAAISSLRRDPPVARPSADNCSYCPVRQLCAEYWAEEFRQGANAPSLDEPQFIDCQAKVLARHGPSSWDCAVEACSSISPGQEFLVRITSAYPGLRPGQQVRLLNVRACNTDQELVGAKRGPVVATVLASSEVFLLSK